MGSKSGPADSMFFRLIDKFFKNKGISLRRDETRQMSSAPCLTPALKPSRKLDRKPDERKPAKLPGFVVSDHTARLRVSDPLPRSRSDKGLYRVHGNRQAAVLLALSGHAPPVRTRRPLGRRDLSNAKRFERKARSRRRNPSHGLKR